MTSLFLLMCNKAHRKSFSVAAAMPSRYQVELQTQIGQLVATGASFEEAKTTLQQLSSAHQKTPEVLA